jgi:hypothetical protein
VATFLVERYWPGVTAVAAQAVTARLGRDATAWVGPTPTTKLGRDLPAASAAPSAGRSRGGSGMAAAAPGGPSVGDRIVVVETIVTASDEVCFWYVEAVSEDDIKVAFKSAGIPIDRISPATALPDTSEVR